MKDLGIFVAAATASNDSREKGVVFQFACQHKNISSGRIALLHVQEPTELQHFIEIEPIMCEEKREEA